MKDHVTYLIDQQASHTLTVKVEGENRSFEPIWICGMNSPSNEFEISREVALELVRLLKEAINSVPEVKKPDNCEYSGKII